MTANLDLSSNLGSLGQIPPVAPAAAPPASRPGGLDSGPISGDFAELLTGYMLKTERQGLTALTTDSIAPGAGLQLLPLGKDLNVITSDTPMPDLASVAAFARAQGLGDAAVQALFGPIAPSATPPLDGVALNTANWLAAPKSAAPVASLLSGRARNAVDADPIKDTKTASGDVFAQINTAAYLQSNGFSPATKAPTAATTPTVMTTEPTATAPIALAQPLPAFAPALGGVNAPKSALENTPTMIAAVNAGVLTQQVGKTPLASLAALVTLNVNEPGEASEPGTEITDDQAATLRLMMTNPQLSKRQSPLAASDTSVNWSNALLQASTTSKGEPQTTTLQDLHLELPSGWSIDDKGTLVVDATADQSAITSAAGAAAPSQPNAPFTNAATKPEASNLLTQADERNAQYQQLANRLGETLSQRLLTQIERGEWKMQMRMQPDGLGHIEVTLDMNAAGLNAIFSADSSVTRELISQGAGRLRASMAEAGMAVANLWVNGDASRQSGGNPTPGQAFKETPRTQNKVIEATTQNAAQVRPAAGLSDALGLDVFA